MVARTTAASGSWREKIEPVFSFGSAEGFVVLCRQVVCASAFQPIAIKSIVIGFRKYSVAIMVLVYVFANSFIRRSNKTLKGVRFAHWTSPSGAFASQIICAASGRPLAWRYVYGD